MSPNNEPASPNENGRKSSFLRLLMNIGIFGFFLVGVVVAAGSFGLFGCECAKVLNPNYGEPTDKRVNFGDIPPAPTPPK